MSKPVVKSRCSGISWTCSRSAAKSYMISWGQNSISGKLGQKVRALRKALKNQRDDLLGFAQVLDEKLDGISQPQDPLFSAADVSVFPQTADLQRLQQVGNQLHQKLWTVPSPLWNGSGQWGRLPERGSLVENLNSRLRILLQRNNWVLLPKSTAILSKSPSIYTQWIWGAGGQESENWWTVIPLVGATGFKRFQQT